MLTCLVTLKRCARLPSLMEIARVYLSPSRVSSQPATHRSRNFAVLAQCAPVFSSSCKRLLPQFFSIDAVAHCPGGGGVPLDYCYPEGAQDRVIPCKMNSSTKNVRNPSRINSSKNKRLKPPVESIDPENMGARVPAVISSVTPTWKQPTVRRATQFPSRQQPLYGDNFGSCGYGRYGQTQSPGRPPHAQVAVRFP